MLRVVSELKNRNLNIHFIVAGGGELLAESKKMAEDQNLPITFLGWCENIEDVLAISDLILLTSDNEGTPIALIQAGMASIPSVTTNVGAVSEVVLHNQTGLITDFSEINIADAIERLIMDPELRKQFGHGAKEFMQSKFNTQVMINNYSSLYKKVILN
jgi:glycosyltransferase involved in cell wall biosynthesis